MSTRIHCITEFLKAKEFKFTEEHYKIIKELSEEIKQKTRLKIPDYSKKFKLECDASDIGIGAVLYQEHGILGYYSKKLNETEQNYSITEKELYAVTKAMFDKISTDTYGPFNLENIKHDVTPEKGYFITITDIYSRLTEVYFAYSSNGKEVIKCFKKWIKKYQDPKYIISDNGTEFRNNKVEKWLKERNIQHVVIPPYAPYANGISEAVNKTITKIIKMNENKSIKNIIRKITFRLYENVNRGLGISPNSLLRGHNFFDLDQNQVTYNNTAIEVITIKKYKIGQEVYIKNQNTKLTSQEYVGPFIIKEVGEKQRWIKVENQEEWIHVRNVKP